MGPQSEGGPPGRGQGGAPYGGDDGRYQTNRDHGQGGYNQQQMMRPRNGYGPDPRNPMSQPELRGPMQETRGPISPVGSNNGRDRDNDPHKDSGERERSRTRRKGSAQLRMCKKCNEPLTGQFVRALGGTFHLDCFKCRVSQTFLICIRFQRRNH
jgi:hypothetical protein